MEIDEVGIDKVGIDKVGITRGLLDVFEAEVQAGLAPLLNNTS